VKSPRHGRNYAEIRVLALVLVMCGFVFAIWGSESAPSTAAADEQDDEAVGEYRTPVHATPAHRY
jgi:hypothetical protein